MSETQPRSDHDNDNLMTREQWEAQSKTEKKKGAKRGVIAGLVATALLAGGGALGVKALGGGEAETPEAKPTPTATSNPSETSEPSAEPTEASNTAESYLADGNVLPELTPLTGNSEAERDQVEAAMLSPLSYEAFDPMVNQAFTDQLTHNSDIADKFMGDTYNKYTETGALIANYNLNVVGASEVWGTSHTWHSKEAAEKYLGELPVVTASDVEKAVQSGNITELATKLVSAQSINYGRAYSLYIEEVKAVGGVPDAETIEVLTAMKSIGESPELRSASDESFTRRMDEVDDAYLNAPKKLEKDYNQGGLLWPDKDVLTEDPMGINAGEIIGTGYIGEYSFVQVWTDNEFNEEVLWNVMLVPAPTRDAESKQAFIPVVMDVQYL